MTQQQEQNLINDIKAQIIKKIDDIIEDMYEGEEERVNPIKFIIEDAGNGTTIPKWSVEFDDGYDKDFSVWLDDEEEDFYNADLERWLYKFVSDNEYEYKEHWYAAREEQRDRLRNWWNY